MPRKRDDNLYQRGGVWYGRVQVAGKEHRRSLRTRDRAEARKLRDDWVQKLNRDRLGLANEHTWPEAVLKYSTEILDKAVKPATARRYRVSLRQIDPFLATWTVERISRSTIADFIAARSAAGATNATIRRDLTAMSAVLAACIDWEWRDNNPALDYSRRGLREQREPIRPPSDAAVKAVIAACPKKRGEYESRFAGIVRFLDATGCRQQEAVTIEWEQIDLARGEITFLKTKTSRPRTIRIADCRPGLSAQLTGTPKNQRKGLVYWHGERRQYQNFASRFSQVVKAAGQDFRCHDLRHKFAIDRLRQGMDIYKLSRHLGHSSVKVTEMYLGHVGTRAGT